MGGRGYKEWRAGGGGRRQEPTWSHEVLPTPNPHLSSVLSSCPPPPCAEPDRKYFTQVADGTPDNTLLLTLGCGKFR